jgi:hypothetical protein
MQVFEYASDHPHAAQALYCFPVKVVLGMELVCSQRWMFERRWAYAALACTSGLCVEIYFLGCVAFFLSIGTIG